MFSTFVPSEMNQVKSLGFSKISPSEIEMDTSNSKRVFAKSGSSGHRENKYRRLSADDIGVGSQPHPKAS